MAQIIDLTPISDHGGSDTSRTVARFSVRLNEDVKLCGLRLQQRPDGQFRLATPPAFGSASAHFAPALYREITSAAVAAFERHYALERSRA